MSQRDQRVSKQAIVKLMFAPDGNTLYSRLDNGATRVWDTATGSERANLREAQATSASADGVPPPPPPANVVACSPDGRLFAGPGDSSQVYVYDTATWTPFMLDGPVIGCLALAFAEGGRALIGISGAGEIVRWDVSDLARVAAYERNGRLQPDHRVPGGVRPSDPPPVPPRGGVPIKTLKAAKLADAGPSVLAAFAPDAKTVAVVRQTAGGAEDPGSPKAPANAPPAPPHDNRQVLDILDVATGRVVRSVQGGPAVIHSLAFSSDGRRLGVMGFDGTATIWSVANGDRLQVLSVAPQAGVVSSLAFMPDGASIVSAGPGPVARLWDVASGREIASLEGHDSSVLGDAAVLAVAFAPDGRTLASAGSDWMVRLWDVASGRHLAALASHNGPVRSLAFAPDGLTLATCGDDRAVLLWDVPTGRARGSLPQPTDASKPRTLAFAPDGAVLATGDGNGVVRLWDMATWRELKSFDSGQPVAALVFTRSGGVLFAAGTWGAVRAWDTTTGQPGVGPVWSYTSVQALDLDRSGRTLAVALADASIKLWDVASHEELQTLRGHSGAVIGVAFSPDGKTLASAGADGTVRLWDPESGQPRGVLEGHSRRVNAVAVSPDGQTLASAGADGAIRLWAGPVGLQQAILPLPSGRGCAVAYSPDGRIVGAAASDGTIKLWNAATGKLSASIPAHTEAAVGLAFSPDGKVLATAGDWAVKLWDWQSGTQEATLAGHTGSVTAVVFSSDGNTLVSAGRDRVVRVWERPAWREARQLRGHSGGIVCVAYRPASTMLASADESGVIRLWDIATGRETNRFLGHTGRVTAVSFSPDGKTLASSADDRTVRLWDVVSGRERSALPAHRAVVTGVAFSPDGKTLATSGADRLVKLWDAATLEERAQLFGHTAGVNGLAFSPDGSVLASAGDDAGVLVWDTGSAATRTATNPLTLTLADPPLRRHREELVSRTRLTRRILEALEEPIPMSFAAETPLEDILKYIKAATTSPTFDGIPIYVDPIGLQEAEKSLNSTVQIDLEGSPLKKTLDLALRPLGLSYRVADGRLTITSAEVAEKIVGAENDAPRQNVDLDNPRVRQLLQKLEEPVAMPFPYETPLEDILKYLKAATATASDAGIQFYVDPVGLLEAEKSMTSPVIYESEGLPLCRSLRELLAKLGLDYMVREHGLIFITSMLSVEDDSRNADAGLRARKTARALEEPIDLDFPNPTPLGTVIEAIEDATMGPNNTGLHIELLPSIDPDKPPAVGKKEERPYLVTYRSKGVPVRQALDEMLAPLGLVYEVEDGDLFIMTKEAKEARDKEPKTVPRGEEFGLQ